MKDPRRLIDGHPHDLAGELISAWRTQRATPRSRARTAQAIGLGASIVASTQTAGAATGVTAAAGTGAAAGKATTMSAATKAVMLKWLLGGVVATSAATVTVQGVIEVASGPARAPSSNVSSARRSPARATHGAAAQPSADAADTAHEPPAASPGAQHEESARPIDTSRVARGPAGEASSGPSSLGRELASLDKVRRSLADHDARAALRALDEYRALDPSGTLAPEAALLHIDALVLAGDSARAARLADAYLAQFPRTPHGARLRRLVEMGQRARTDVPP